MNASTPAQEICRRLIQGEFNAIDLAAIQQAVTFVRAQVGRKTIRALKRGDQVKWNSPKMGRIETGVVKAVKIKYVTVETSSGMSWRVPASLLEIV